MLCACFLINIGNNMKYIKSIDLQSEGQGISYQRGQTAKDKFNNLHVFQGIGKDGRNVWLLVRVYQHDTDSYRFQNLKAVVRELRAAKRQLRRIVKLESSFGRGKFNFGKDVRQQYYLENTKGA